jgi:uncharacterized protein
MTTELVVLCLAAALAGVVNSIAGGGTLLTFPALTLVHGSTAEATVIANATSTIALFPGSLAAMWGYRREFEGSRNWIVPLIVPSLLGGALGTWLVVTQPASVFQMLVPWLILIATVLFLLQPVITRWTGIGHPHASPSLNTRLGIAGFQFLIALYGGYFGAGIGILMLSALALMGLNDIHRMNAVKTLLASAINGMSVVVFLWSGRVNWKFAVPMIVSAIIGGFLGASVARRLDKNLIRYTVVMIGLLLSAYYFLSVYTAT